MKPFVTVMDWIYGYEIPDEIEGLKIAFATPHSMMHEPRAFEKSNLELDYIMNGKDFNSIEEFNKFLERLRTNPELKEKELEIVNSDPEKRNQLIYMELIDQAWRSNGIEACKNVMKSLLYSQSPSDAYIWIATNIAKTGEEDFNLLNIAYELAKLTLDKKYFNENKGNFWGLIETRPYMRAFASFSDILWADGEEEESIHNFEELLNLDSYDRIGIRLLLASRYIYKKMYDKFDDLIKRFSNDKLNPFFLYPSALLSYIRNGPNHLDTKNTIRLAINSNPLIALGILSFDDYIDSNSIKFYTKRSYDEAQYFLSIDEGTWYSEKGAESWLRDQLEIYEQELSDISDNGAIA